MSVTDVFVYKRAIETNKTDCVRTQSDLQPALIHIVGACRLKKYYDCKVYQEVRYNLMKLKKKMSEKVNDLHHQSDLKGILLWMRICSSSKLDVDL